MSGMLGNLEKAVAAKMAPKPGPATSPPGWTQGKKTGWKGGTMPPGLAKKQASKRSYSVEGAGVTVGPFRSARAASKRASRETRVYNQGGFNKGKAPEMVEKPRGSTAVARFPNGQRVPSGPK